MRTAPWTLVLVLVMAPGARPAAAALVLHYTFDEADRFANTFIDKASGTNNGDIIGQVGTGIPGVLDEAIRLPNDDGLSYVRLPAAENPMPNGAAERTIAFWFNQELVGDENKMFGYGSSTAGQSFDVSLEGGGVRLRYAGGNVTWGSGLDFVGADGGFRHLAIRVPAGASDYLDVEVLLDGELLTATPTAGNPATTPINTGGGLPTELNIGRSPAFSPAGDFIGLIDDFRVYDTALTDFEVAELAGMPNNLSLEVDPLTGAGLIRNRSEVDIPLSYYELTSSTGSIDASGWAGVHQQQRVGFPGGNGVGDGWEALGVATAAGLAEGWPLGESVLGAGEWFPVGAVYDPAMPQELDFVFQQGASFRNGSVVFTAAGPAGDFDLDGKTDTADLQRWQAATGVNGSADSEGDGDSDLADLLVWQRGVSVPPAASTASVPEPTACTLSLLAAACGICWQRAGYARIG